MTYRYSMNGSHHATVYRETGDELVAVAFITSRNLSQPADIPAIARATVGALNGTTAEPRLVWHPKAVEALRAARNVLGDMNTNYDVFQLLADALALVDQPPPAEKVVGWALMDESKWPLWASVYESPGEAQRSSGDAGRDVRIVRLVEEPAP